MMRRRDFIALSGSFAISASAQERKAAAIGFLRPTGADGFAHLVAAVGQGMREAGYPADRISIEARWAYGREERLAELAAELVNFPVAVIVASHTAALAAKTITTTVPIVFATGADPVAGGLVSRLNHPGGNVTGVSFFDVPIAGKRLELLYQLVPKTELIAVLQDPRFSEREMEKREVESAARALGQRIVTVTAGHEDEIDEAFIEISKSGAGALLVGSGPFFNAQRQKLVALAAKYKLPSSYVIREYVAAGGLFSYGSSQRDAYRRAGIYVARILRGEKAGDLPVELPTKYELSLNAKTAKTLGIEIPSKLLFTADEVIE